MNFRDSRPWPRPRGHSHPATAPARGPRRPDLRAGLSAALLQAVRAQDFGRTADHWHGGAPLTHFPSIDLALVVFPLRGAPQFANVLFSREHPLGWAARIGPGAGAVQDVQFLADLQDAKGQSPAWQAGRSWKQMTWAPLTDAGPAAGAGTARFVAPYPASLLKLMVAVGLGLAVDRGLCRWDELLPSLAPMITVSSNEATDACVAQLHRLGLLGGPVNALNAVFVQHGLATLQLNDTTPAGGWRNADGAGVGHIHMTAWDTVRLLWLLDAEAPPAPWLPPGTAPLLQPATRDALRALLAAQTLDEVLSSGSLRGLPGWVPGLPDAPAFAHKTGTTDNYASDAGIVRTGIPGTDGAEGAHYIVAALTSLGRRYAAVPECATTWRLPALGAALHALATQFR